VTITPCVDVTYGLHVTFRLQERVMDDEQILAQAGRTELRSKAGLILVLVGAIAALAGAVEWIPTAPADKHLWQICAAVAAVAIAGGLALRLTARMPAEAKRGRLAMIRAERSQAKRQVAYLLMPLSLGLMLPGVVRATSRIAGGAPIEHIELFVVICFIAFLLTFALLIAGRGLDLWATSVLNDELSRDLRAKALLLGYAILLPGLAGLFVVGLLNRDLAIELAPVLAAIGVAGPALRLFWLERAAGAGALEA
jgi:hypothetical protein